MPTLIVQSIGLFTLIAGVAAGYWAFIRPRELTLQARGLMILLILTMMGGFVGSTAWWFDAPQGFSWDLPPLASRMLGAAAVAFGFLNLAALLKPSWQLVRLALLMLFVYLTPLAVAIILFHMNRFDPDAPITFVFFILVIGMIVPCGWYLLRQPHIIPPVQPVPPSALISRWMWIVTGVMTVWGLALFITDTGSDLIWVWQGDLLTTRLIAVMLLAIAAGAYYSLRSADAAQVMLNIVMIYGIGVAIANLINYLGDKPIKPLYVAVFGVMDVISWLLTLQKPKTP